MTIRRAYVDGPFGQMHTRQSAPTGNTPLIALHATAYSSQSFIPLMAAFGNRRQVIALDAPGYGESDCPKTRPDMADYADSISVAISELGIGPVDLLGYHTGAYMAAELAIQQPKIIRKIVLIGVPYFQALGIAEWRERLCQGHKLDERLDQFAERWGYFVSKRDPRVTLDRAFANFLDELKSWPNGATAHEAMFDWDADGRLPLVKQPVLILNPTGHLAVASRAASKLIPDCTLIDLPALDGPVLEVSAGEIATEIDDWLEIAS